MFLELKIYITCFISFLVIDFIWIGILMKSFYVQQLQTIGRIYDGKFEPNLAAAAGVYIALSVGVVQFVLPKINQDSSWFLVFAIGALFGFVVYGTYDFTNYSTLKDWSLPMTFADIAWGGFLCGLVTLITKFVRD